MTKHDAKKLSGEEVFRSTGREHTFTVLDFWQYAFSSLNSNMLRGVLAEFLVENALKGRSQIAVRDPWRDYDVEYQGSRIEVKCAAYLQEWEQKKLSRICFSRLKVKKSLRLTHDDEPSYKSGVYIFALLKHQGRLTLDLLDLDQWCFYVLDRDGLRQLARDGGSISLGTLQKAHVRELHFRELQTEVNRVIHRTGQTQLA